MPILDTTPKDHWTPAMRDEFTHCLHHWTDERLNECKQHLEANDEVRQQALQLVQAELDTRQAKACPRNANKYCAHPNCEEFD